jgi:hypothetical protein
MRDAQRIASRGRRSPGQQSREFAHEIDEFHPSDHLRMRPTADLSAVSTSPSGDEAGPTEARTEAEDSPTAA